MLVDDVPSMLTVIYAVTQLHDWKCLTMPAQFLARLGPTSITSTTSLLHRYGLTEELEMQHISSR